MTGSRAARDVQLWPAFRKRRENPYTYLFAQALSEAGCNVREFTPFSSLPSAPDVIHVHWPEFVVRPSHGRFRAHASRALLGVLAVSRERGTKIVWTAHNVQPRSADPVVADAMETFVSNLDGIVALSQGSISQLLTSYPPLANVPKVVVPHGLYEGEYPLVSKELARQVLGLALDALIVLLPGQIRSDKQHPRLARSLLDATKSKDLLVLVAGETKDPTAEDALRELAASDPRLQLRTGLLDNSELGLLLSAATCVAGSMSPGNSGTAHLAMTARRPLLTPRHAEILEISAIVGPDWFQFYDDSPVWEDLAQVATWTAPSSTTLRPLAWDSVGNSIRDFYELL